MKGGEKAPPREGSGEIMCGQSWGWGLRALRSSRAGGTGGEPWGRKDRKRRQVTRPCGGVLLFLLIIKIAYVRCRIKTKNNHPTVCVLLNLFMHKQTNTNISFK